MASWPSVLQGIIKSPTERQRLSTALGVTTMTLSRWASGESKPQRPHLIHLVQVVHPNQRLELIDALEEVYPEIQTWLNEDTTDHIPPEFFAQVLSIRTTTTDSLRFWRISEVVLKQALVQLDPNRLGMSVKLLQCMPLAEPDHRVHSLRERTGKGTPPWTADLEHDVLFLGVESLSGTAVETRHVASNDNLRTNKNIPSVQDAFEVSAAAHPIRLEGRIAGCFLASSTQEGYFSQQRLNLLATFSDLLALAFDKHEFYPIEQISLRVMPIPEIQRPILSGFRDLATIKFQEAAHRHEQKSNAAIELLAWQELENKLQREQERLIEQDRIS
jgi:GAF domain